LLPCFSAFSAFSPFSIALCSIFNALLAARQPMWEESSLSSHRPRARPGMTERITSSTSNIPVRVE
jgi:hypothetical protein